MGTTLTGTTPQDTYDSLIKVTDNGPLSGSLKTLTDGLGNDSALALSTGAASITGTLAVTAGVNLATASGNVGIGTTSPLTKFSVVDATNSYAATFDGAGGTSLVAIGTTGGGPSIAGYTAGFAASTNLLLNPDGGNVGIGTSSPAYKLQINASGGNGISLLGDVNNEASVLFGDSGSAVIGRLTYSNIDDSMRIFTNGSEKVRITSAGALLVGTTTAPTVNTGSVAVIGSSVIHSGVLSFPSPYSGSVQIDIVYSNWGSNNVIGLVDVIVGLREYGSTSGTAFGKVFATNSGASAGFDTFNTTNVTTSQCTIAAASGGNYTLRITIDPSNNTDAGSFYLNIPTGGGVTVSSISVTFV